MLTTAVSFASLSLTPGQGIQEFSMAGVLASVTNFVCLMTFLPLLLPRRPFAPIACGGCGRCRCCLVHWSSTFP